MTGIIISLHIYDINRSFLTNGRDRMVVGLTTTYAINAYHN